MTGKLADTVMTVRNGEQIARKYQPVVFNPSTPAQIAQRAKMKLLSQLSAVMAPVIAMRKIGPVSSRNLFTKKNFPLTTFSNDAASIDLLGIQLTAGVTVLPTLGVARTEQGIYAEFTSDVPHGPVDVDRVVYCMFEVNTDDTIRFVESSMATSAGVDNNWRSGFMTAITGKVLILAYGMRDNTEEARVAFGNLTAPVAEQVAKIITTSSLTESDVTFTTTKGTFLNPANRDENNNRSSMKK